MAVTPGQVEKHYVDALGKRHAVPGRALEAIQQALRRRGPSPPASVVVANEGDDISLGPADVRLEDGTTRTVDRTLPRDIPAGYHDIRRRDGSTARLIVAPSSCYLPDDFRTWGWAIQLYAARSRRSWGIGDLADLRRLGRWAAKEGAGIAMVNPLAAATPIVPQQPSPYFPSSRRFRNPLYLRIEEVEGAETLGDLVDVAACGRRLNRDRHIDRDEVFRLKMGALERIWAVVRRREHPAFDRFVTDQGDGLREFATFAALAEEFTSGWHAWPSRFRHPASPAVREASRRRPTADRIRFHQWVQFQIDRQLQRASKVVPVMQDLPIGFDPDGADAWAFQDVLADGITVGAPPDEFNTKGQDWGLPPFVPDALRADGYRPFIETIRACLRHAGGLRIDHVMGLFRLFWIPAGMQPRDGAYVRGYADDLLAIVALESRRARAVIVGEDLGTVEEEARQHLMSRHVLSYRLVWFEKTRPPKFPEEALAAVTTHDLPTIAGLWSGSDLEAQKRLGLSPNEKAVKEIHQRVARTAEATPRTPVTTVIARVHEMLGEAPSRIVTATLEDAMAVEERPNMPATSDEWPNWSIALPRPIETLEDDSLARRITKALRRD